MNIKNLSKSTRHRLYLHLTDIIRVIEAEMEENKIDIEEIIINKEEIIIALKNTDLIIKDLEELIK
jgi:hypothetical protein